MRCPVDPHISSFVSRPEDKMSDLPEAMETLSLEIRNEYVVGYFSNHTLNDGKYHKVRVEVQPPAGTR